MNLGFIGEGIMGNAMAAHLQDVGRALFVNATGLFAESLTAAGAMVCGTGRQVSGQSEIIFVMVPDACDVEAPLFSEGVVTGPARTNVNDFKPILIEGSTAVKPPPAKGSPNQFY